MDVFNWLEATLSPRDCTSEEFIYDDMDSQSGRLLPIIYQPFNAAERSHWQDRGSLFDYLFSTQGEGKKLLDLGPGDGWPSLIVAPWAGEVVGVEGSLRRVAVCTENAGRLGIENAHFVHVAPGTRLPFEDDSFDGAMAASSIEQTPDPYATLQELFRVLRPSGRLRVGYESLGQYRDGQEREAWLWPIDERTCRLMLYDRHIDRERVRQYGVTFAMSGEELTGRLPGEGKDLSFTALTPAGLDRLRPTIVDARVCTTIHPSGRTCASWLSEIGFRQVLPTHSGARFAGGLFDRIPKEHRPTEMQGVDALVRPAVEVAVQMPAPWDIDPMITAIK